MQDYDDTGMGRHGSPPPSYDTYGDDDDERAVGSRTPHHGDGGQEEEDGRYLMDHHEFDQSSGGESISPLYGGGLQRDEPVSAWGVVARVQRTCAGIAEAASACPLREPVPLPVSLAFPAQF